MVFALKILSCTSGIAASLVKKFWSDFGCVEAAANADDDGVETRLYLVLSFMPLSATSWDPFIVAILLVLLSILLSDVEVAILSIASIILLLVIVLAEGGSSYSLISSSWCIWYALLSSLVLPSSSTKNTRIYINQHYFDNKNKIMEAFNNTCQGHYFIYLHSRGIHTNHQQPLCKCIYSSNKSVKKLEGKKNV